MVKVGEDCEPSERVRTGSEQPAARFTILAVTSDTGLGRSIRLQLESRGFEIVIVRDWAECDMVLGGLRPALVVLDALSQAADSLVPVESSLSGQQIPLLIVMKDGGRGQVQRMIHAGANAFVVRPLDSRALHGLIRALLRRSGSAEEGGDPLDGLYRIVEAQYREHVDACAARNRLSRRWGFREEIVSDVLLELWRALPGFVAYDASAGFRLAVADDEMRGWLAVTTANRCAARGRRAARHERKLAKTREILAHELRGGDSPPFFQG